jgi:hypothetical protein
MSQVMMLFMALLNFNYVVNTPKKGDREWYLYYELVNRGNDKDGNPKPDKQCQATIFARDRVTAEELGRNFVAKVPNRRYIDVSEGSYFRLSVIIPLFLLAGYLKYYLEWF